MNSKRIIATVLAIATVSSVGAIGASARQVGEFNNFKVTYSGNEKFT